MEQWWEAKTINLDKGVFTLQWRDYPQLPVIMRGRSASAWSIRPRKSGDFSLTCAFVDRARTLSFFSSSHPSTKRS